MLRYKYDCILSTSKSINYDNSLLNCRINGLEKHKSALFIVDLKLRLKKNLSLNSLLKNRKTYLITLRENFKKSKNYKKIGFRIILINSLKNKEDFEKLNKKIYKLGYSRMFIETGLTFLKSLIKNKIINDLFIFKSKNKLGKKGKNNISINYLKKFSPKLLTINLNGDKLYKKEF